MQKPFDVIIDNDSVKILQEKNLLSAVPTTNN